MAKSLNASYVNFKCDDPQDDNDKIWYSLLDLIYPVGAYYISENKTTPAILFGGSWAPVENYFLYAQPNTENLTNGGSNNAIIPEHSHELTAPIYIFEGIKKPHIHKVTTTIEDHYHSFNFVIPDHQHGYTVTVPNHQHHYSTTAPHEHYFSFTGASHRHKYTFSVPAHKHKIVNLPANHDHEFIGLPDILMIDHPKHQHYYASTSSDYKGIFAYDWQWDEIGAYQGGKGEAFYPCVKYKTKKGTNKQVAPGGGGVTTLTYTPRGAVGARDDLFLSGKTDVPTEASSTTLHTEYESISIPKTKTEQSTPTVSGDTELPKNAKSESKTTTAGSTTKTPTGIINTDSRKPSLSTTVEDAKIIPEGNIKLQTNGIVEKTGESVENANMPRYQGVYCWKRVS